MFPLLVGAAIPETHNQEVGHPCIVNTRSIPRRQKKTSNLANPKPHPPAVVSGRAQKYRVRDNPSAFISHPEIGRKADKKLSKEESRAPIPQLSVTETLLSEDDQRQRAHTHPGSARSRRVSVELLIRHFESVSFNI
jgi:hypothetical protein